MGQKALVRRVLVRGVCVLYCLAGCLGGAEGAFAQRRGEVTLKVASLVPESTDWGQALNKFVRDVDSLTGGDVRVIVYHNAVVGNEDDVIRKLKLNQIQAGVLTSYGMGIICPEVMALSYPFLIRNDRELDAVLAGIKPELEERIEAKGVKLLAWSKAGWVRFFARSPILLPQDVKRMKMATFDGPLTDAFKALGWALVPTDASELMTSLNAHRIDALFQSPVYVASYQLFTLAGHMTSLNIAPLLGGLVINQTAWGRIPAKYREGILALAAAMEKENDGSIARLEAAALDTMTRYGLETHDLSGAQKQLWYDDMDSAEAAIVGTAFDRATKSRIDALLKAHRAQTAALYPPRTR